MKRFPPPVFLVAWFLLLALAVPRPVLADGIHERVRQTVVGGERDHVAPVVARQPGIRTEPEEAEPVLVDGLDVVRRQPVGTGERVEHRLRVRTRERGHEAHGEESASEDGCEPVWTGPNLGETRAGCGLMCRLGRDLPGPLSRLSPSKNEGSRPPRRTPPGACRCMGL